MMMQAKKRTNAPSSQGSRSNKDREERLSLLGYDKASPSRITTATMTMSPPSSGNSATLSFRKERRRVAKSDEAEEERVSLMGTKKMKPRIENSNNNNIKPSGPSRLVRRFGKGNKNSPPWTVSRTMKYIALMVISACTTFLLLRKEPKAVQWEEYQNMLDPDEGKETRCFEQSFTTKDERCTCPDPTKPLPNTTSTLWMSHHKSMVHYAKYAMEDLDIVFFGDDMIEELSGTKVLGSEIADGMEEYFAKTFTKTGGGKLNGLALGSYGDTGPNLLWHWENGISEAALKPKLWFIMVGGNDLFKSKCSNRFVFANILNVLKSIFESHPNSEFIVHGIMPRSDDPASTTLGHVWKRAQDINFLIRKFTDHASHIHYVNAATKFTIESGMKGRRHLDPELMSDGMNPTDKGMRVWGDYIEKKVSEILHGRKKWDKQQKAEADAAKAAAADVESNNEN